MKVFISWSGEKSQAVAELLAEWLQCVLQAVEPWVSSKDIERGTFWFGEITDILKETCTGIICVTKSNKDNPWILFETGALTKGLSSSRVCPILIDLEASDVQPPLSLLNFTWPKKDSMFSLVKTLNNCLGEKALKESTLFKVFETYWPQFEGEFTNINNNVIEDNSGTTMKRTNDDILSEILFTTRSLDKRVRSLENAPDSIGWQKKDLLNSEDLTIIRNSIYELLKNHVPYEVIDEAFSYVPSAFIDNVKSSFKYAHKKKQDAE